MNIKITKLNKNAIIPTRGSNEAAGMDLYACTSSPIIIAPHDTVKISTGIAMEIPDGYFGGVFARSGLATKQGLRPSNCCGVIDSDYRGEVNVGLLNHGTKTQTVLKGERVAQMMILPLPKVNLIEVEELSETERGTGGFGSTGR